MPRFAANLTMLFTELPFMQRFEAAASAGFQAVEYLFPYPFPKQELAAALRANGLQQVLHNLPAGQWDAGERGIACHPDRNSEFRQGVASAIDYATALGCRRVNCLVGKLPQGATPNDVQPTLVANLRYAARELEAAGIQMLVEPINRSTFPASSSRGPTRRWRSSTRSAHRTSWCSSTSITRSAPKASSVPR